MIASLLAKLRIVLDEFAPGAETLAQRATLALQHACCALLMEVARLDPADTMRKREAVAQAMRNHFAVPDDRLAEMIADAGRPENRLTSYYRQVVLINSHFANAQKVRFIEGLWRVATADGKIDMYEDALVRELADLLYVSHTDFVLARRRAQDDGTNRRCAGNDR